MSGRLQRQPHFSGQNQRLACDIGAREVIARVGLRVAPPICVGHHSREWQVTSEGVEDVRQRAGKDSLHANHAVARADEVAKGLDHRQPGADRGRAEVVGPVPGPRLPDTPEELERSRGRLLVGRHDVHTAPQPTGVSVVELSACRAIHDYGVGQVVRVDVGGEAFQVCGLTFRLERFLPTGEVDALIVEDHLRGPHDAANAHVDVEALV